MEKRIDALSIASIYLDNTAIIIKTADGQTYGVDLLPLLSAAAGSYLQAPIQPDGSRNLLDTLQFSNNEQLRFDMSSVYGTGSYACFDTGDDALNLRYRSTTSGDDVTNGSTVQFQPGAIYLYGDQVIQLIAQSDNAVITKGFLSDYVTNVLGTYASTSYVTGALAQYVTTTTLNTYATQTYATSQATQAINTYRNANYNGYVTQLVDYDTKLPRATFTVSSGPGGIFACADGSFFQAGNRFIMTSMSTRQQWRGYIGNGGGYSTIALSFDDGTATATVNGPFIVALDAGALATSNTAGVVKLATPGNALEGATDAGVITNNTATIRLTNFKAAAQTWTKLQTFNGGYKVLVPTSTIKNAVMVDTYTNGELQGTQPAGSMPGMKFCNANYRYEYMNGMADTDGTSFVWVRLLKST